MCAWRSVLRCVHEWTFRRTWAARVLPLGLVLAAAAGLIAEVLQVHLDQFAVLLDHQSLLQDNRRRPPSHRRVGIQVQLKDTQEHRMFT